MKGYFDELIKKYYVKRGKLKLNFIYKILKFYHKKNLCSVINLFRFFVFFNRILDRNRFFFMLCHS